MELISQEHDAIQQHLHGLMKRYGILKSCNGTVIPQTHLSRYHALYIKKGPWIGNYKKHSTITTAPMRSDNVYLKELVTSTS